MYVTAGTHFVKVPVYHEARQSGDHHPYLAHIPHDGR